MAFFISFPILMWNSTENRPDHKIHKYHYFKKKSIHRGRKIKTWVVPPSLPHECQV